jgi:threonine aldolase
MSDVKNDKIIDIRSDTVTKPTMAMRCAAFDAEVGDDVYGDDPTVTGLEALGAEMLGKEAALFVPSGVFGNQLALFTWCPRGTEVILGEDCHIIQHEAGSSAVIAGVQLRQLPAPDGIFDTEEMEKRIRKADLHAPATSLIEIENAHSLGKAVPVSNIEAVYKIAGRHNIPVHLDGARIFNAAAALGVEASVIARNADSVMLCLAKGLCAPVGSLLLGDKAFIEKARYKRKIMGGGMRQAGMIAACGIVALQEMTGRLSEDHERARTLEKELRKNPDIEVVDGNDINMVFFRYSGYAADVEAEFKKRGILINAKDNAGFFRFVTHYWIGDDELSRIIAASREIFGPQSGFYHSV